MAAKKQEVVVAKKSSLLAKFGERYSLDPQKFLETVSKTVFKDAQNQEQVITLLMVADQYGLNPVTREIMAFPDKGGGVVPVVGVDGWNRIAQQHPMFNGVEFRYADKDVVPDGGKRCPVWVECIVHRKDRGHPVVVREYLDECYRKTGPWQSHTKRMLRHKALIQGYRTAFGFHGIYDEDEAQRMYVEGDGATTPAPASGNAARAREALGATTESREPSDAPEAPSGVASVVVDEATDFVEWDEVTGEVVEQYDVRGRDEPPIEEGEVVEPPPVVTKTQLAAVMSAKTKGGWTDDLFDRLLLEYGVKKPEELDREQALDLIRHLLAGVADREQEELDV